MHKIFESFLLFGPLLTTSCMLQDPDHLLTDEGNSMGMVDPTYQHPQIIQVLDLFLRFNLNASCHVWDSGKPLNNGQNKSIQFLPHAIKWVYSFSNWVCDQLKHTLDLILCLNFLSITTSIYLSYVPLSLLELYKICILLQQSFELFVCVLFLGYSFFLSLNFCSKAVCMFKTPL